MQTDASIKEELASTIRGIMGKPKLEVIFQDTVDGTSADYHPNNNQFTIQLAPQTAMHQLRGITDANASKHAYYNKLDLELVLQKHSDQRSLLEKLEHTRCHAIAGNRMAGVKHNISDYYAITLSNNDQEIGLQEILPIATYDLLTNAQTMLAPGHQAMKEALISQLKNHPKINASMHDSAAFAHAIMAFLQQLHTQGNEANPEHVESQETIDSPIQTAPENEAAEQESQKQGAQPSGEDNGKNAATSQPAIEDAESQEEDAASMQAATPNQVADENTTSPLQTYCVYSNAYDAIVNANELATAEELTVLRQQLDLKLAEMQDVTTRLAAKLQRVLLASQIRSWQFHLDEGQLDPNKLTQLITNPFYAYPFRQESSAEYKDTIITLLLDNSGSMRGRPITITALTADILARTLERCGVKVEILGFTTQHWKGGQSRKLWEQNGAPQNSGRLNDILHIIYKSADTPMRRAKPNLGLMLKEGLLKENIDGEALLWAHQRLLKRHEERKILMVISDGAPVDDSTLSSNDSGLLDGHLRAAIKHIETERHIQLMAIGVGHNVNHYYDHALTINHADELGDAITQHLLDLFKS